MSTVTSRSRTSELSSTIHKSVVPESRITLLDVISQTKNESIWQARYRKTSCAVKTFRGKFSLLEIEDIATRDDILALFDIRGPQICTFFGICLPQCAQHNGELWVIIEFSVERSLRNLLESDESLRGDRQRTLELLIEVASGLEDLHRAGVAMYDLRPETIYITPSGEAKLAYFGACNSSGFAATATLRRTSITNTVDPLIDNVSYVSSVLSYTAPEHIPRRASCSNIWQQSDSSVGSALTTDVGSVEGDMFAFGILMLELLTQRDAIEFLRGPPPTLAASEPPALRALLARCLSVNPAHRPSAVEAVKVLEQLCATPALDQSPHKQAADEAPQQMQDLNTATAAPVCGTEADGGDLTNVGSAEGGDVLRAEREQLLAECERLRGLVQGLQYRDHSTLSFASSTVRNVLSHAHLALGLIRTRLISFCVVTG